MKLPPPTDVTIVWNGQLIHSTWKAGTIRRKDRMLIAANVTRASEGTRWVRGHVTEADEAGAALLAANAMQSDSDRERVQQLVKKFWKQYPDAEFAREAMKARR